MDVSIQDIQQGMKAVGAYPGKEAIEQAALDSFGYMDEAILILDQHYRFYYINKAMAGNDRVTSLFKVLSDDHVAFKDAQYQSLLEEKVDACLGVLKGDSLRGVQRFLMRCEGRFYQVKVKPWFNRLSAHDALQDQPFILMVIKDLNEDRLVSAKEISSVFGLSTTEAIICRYICKGYALDHIASIRKVSKHTVRHQIKSIYQKTKTSSQSQLVAFVLSVASH